MRKKNGIPIGGPDEVMVTTGGIHGVFAICQGLLEPGDEVLVPDPEWPPAQGNVACARAVPVPYPLHESRGWRPDVDEMRGSITPKTRAIYLNSPNNPTGGVLTRADLEAIADLARERDLWVISDEAYEDVLFDGHEHISIASLPGMYARTIPLYTFSKTYAITGLRLGYIAVARPGDPRPRAKDAVLHRLQHVVAHPVRRRRRARRTAGRRRAGSERAGGTAASCSIAASAGGAGGVFTGQPPAGAFYAFLKIDPAWRSPLAGRAQVAVVGDDGIPDQARPHRLRARRRFRRARRRLRAVLFRARSRGAHGRAGVDEGSDDDLARLSP